MRVSVLMPVYNGEKYLREAIESILAQTFSDFELLIIDDGSKDHSSKIIASYNDPRIRLVKNDGNKGLIWTLNRGIDLAQGEYIVRMDCDDISRPERLERQVSFMDRNPEIGVCGTLFKVIGTGNIPKHPHAHAEIIEGFLHTGCVIGHPTVIIRKSLLTETGFRYDPKYPHAEDYALWAALSNHAKFANIQEVLLDYRVHSGQVSTQHSLVQSQGANRVRANLLCSLLARPTDDDVRTFCLLLDGSYVPSIQFLWKIRDLLVRVLNANSSKNRYQHEQFENLVSTLWENACIKSRHLGTTAVFMYLSAPIPKNPTRAVLSRLKNRLYSSKFSKLIFSAEKSVVVQLTGTLGSQMFQYATGLRLAKERNVPLKLDISAKSVYRHFHYALGELQISGKLADDHQTEKVKKGHGWAFLIHRRLERKLPLRFRALIEEKCSSFDTDVLSAGNRIYLKGDWKDQKYFLPIRELLLKEFLPIPTESSARQILLQEIKTTESVGIHIQKASYCVSEGNARPINWPASCPPEYYQSALALISERLHDPKFFVFTDDLSWLTSVLPKLSQNRVIEVSQNDPKGVYLMSQCKHQILSNSDFSWWAAWLNPNTQKQVIVPREWFQITKRTTDSILPKEWVQI